MIRNDWLSHKKRYVDRLLELTTSGDAVVITFLRISKHSLYSLECIYNKGRVHPGHIAIPVYFIDR